MSKYLEPIINKNAKHLINMQGLLEQYDRENKNLNKQVLVLMEENKILKMDKIKGNLISNLQNYKNSQIRQLKQSSYKNSLANSAVKKSKQKNVDRNSTLEKRDQAIQVQNQKLKQIGKQIDQNKGKVIGKQPLNKQNRTNKTKQQEQIEKSVIQSQKHIKSIEKQNKLPEIIKQSTKKQGEQLEQRNKPEKNKQSRISNTQKQKQIKQPEKLNKQPKKIIVSLPQKKDQQFEKTIKQSEKFINIPQNHSKFHKSPDKKDRDEHNQLHQSQNLDSNNRLTRIFQTVGNSQSINKQQVHNNLLFRHKTSVQQESYNKLNQIEKNNPLRQHAFIQKLSDSIYQDQQRSLCNRNIRSTSKNNRRANHSINPSPKISAIQIDKNKTPIRQYPINNNPSKERNANLSMSMEKKRKFIEVVSSKSNLKTLKFFERQYCC